MNCAWSEFLAVVPHRLRMLVDRLGKKNLEELHLRIGQPVELIIGGTSHLMETHATRDDILFAINTASRYSPWSSATVRKGYISVRGGHRIGICGECVVQGGVVTGIRDATSLCLRVAREFQGIASRAPQKGSLLILGPPGAGKTTLLRDMIRLRSQNGQTVAVVDERGELFPAGNHFETGIRTDVLTGCSKSQGVEMALRTMGPRCIAVDEITALEDCRALMSAGWCGVDLLATAHASGIEDLRGREVYKPLFHSELFSQIIVLNRDRSWQLERMKVCT